MSGFWSERVVFVTGATGLLGGWLVKDLLDQNAEVVVLVRDGSPRSLLVRDGDISRVSTIAGDIHDWSLLRRSMAEYAVDTVFHLAAQTIVGVAKVDPLGTLETNVRGTWNILEAARLTGVKQVVVASSDKAYGASDQLPYREDTPLRGKYPYDVSKSCTDLICSMYAATFGLNVAIARCANLFGGGDLNFNRVIPGAIRSALAGQRFVIRSDGKFIRDLLYVKDAAKAYMCLAERLASDPHLKGEAFNFGLELRMTVIELVNMVLNLVGRADMEPIIQNNVSAEIKEQTLSTEKAKKLLNWLPHYTVERGLIETIAWYENLFSGSAENPRMSALAAGS